MTAAGFRLPGGESTSARLRAVERELADRTAALAASQADLTASEKLRKELLSIVVQIGDAISPTGERPEEALGTLVRDVEALVEHRDRVEGERDEAQHELQHKKFALGMAATRLAHWKEQAGHWRTKHDLTCGELESEQRLRDQLMELLRHLADQAMADGWTRVAERTDLWAAAGYEGSWQDARYAPPAATEEGTHG